MRCASFPAVYYYLLVLRLGIKNVHASSLAISFSYEVCAPCTCVGDSLWCLGEAEYARGDDKTRFDAVEEGLGIAGYRGRVGEGLVGGGLVDRGLVDGELVDGGLVDGGLVDGGLV